MKNRFRKLALTSVMSILCIFGTWTVNGEKQPLGSIKANQ